MTEKTRTRLRRSLSHITKISDIDHDMLPVADSTAVDGSSISFDVIASSDINFDITGREVDAVEEVHEESHYDALSETVLEDRGTTWTILEGGSQRRTKVLVSSLGYSYGVKRENQSSTIWRCTSRSKAIKCPVTVRQAGDVFFQSREHVHPSVPDKQLRLQVYSKVRQNACETVFRPATTIAEDVLLEHRGPDDVARPKKSLLKRAANRARAKLRPEEPKSLDFEVVGDPFRKQGQLFSIHAFIERQGQTKQMPLLFALMSRRTQADYVAVFRAVLEQTGRAAVEGFVADFEQAVWQAVREVFPGREMKGCAFHWGQAVWWHVQEVGLAEIYRRRVGVHNFIRMLLALQFLPAAHIRIAFQKQAETATSAATQALVGYMDRQWMRHTVFGIEDWSVFRQSVRTNNDVEGWHNRLNGKAGGSGLGFYRLVPLLRREAELTQMAVESGDLERATTSKRNAQQKALTSLWDRYMDGEIRTSDFLAKVSDVYRLKC